MDLFEIVLILALALIVLGPERLPEVLKVAGKVMRELRLASNSVMRELTDVMDEVPDVRTPLKALPKPAVAAEQAPQAQPGPGTEQAPAAEAASKAPEPPSEST